MITCRTKSAEDTREMASALAATVRPGDVLLLAGDLGAGKTTFTQGLAKALGVTDTVTSPTFTLMHQYQAAGDVTLVHADVYRLDNLQEVIDLAIPELVDDCGVAVVEWGDVAQAVLPQDFLEVHLTFVDEDDDARVVGLRTVGTSWAARTTTLAASLERWVAGDGS